MDQTPKKFTRHKSYAEIKAQCKEQGLYFGSWLYDQGRSDFVVVCRKQSDTTNGEGFVFFNLYSGRFHGETNKILGSAIVFNESSQLDGTPWYDALLEFFFASTPKQAPAPVRKGQMLGAALVAAALPKQKKRKGPFEKLGGYDGS